MYENVANIIAWHYEAEPLKDFLVTQDGPTVSIAYWNLPGPQPTIAEVLALEAQYLAARAQDAPLRRVEKALERDKKTRVLAACILRLSSSWASMTTAEKNKATAIIDAAGAKLLTALRG